MPVEKPIMKIIVASFAALMALMSTAHSCTAEKASYRHMEDQSFSISFSKQANPKAWSDIQASLHMPSRKLDFEFTASNGYEVLSMVVLTQGIEQENTIAVGFLNKDLKSQGLPQSGSPAAEYLYAPELGPWLWYADLQPREYIPPGLWKLDKCS